LLTYLFRLCDVFISTISLDLQLKTFKGVIGQALIEKWKLKRLHRSQQRLERFPNEISIRSINFDLQTKSQSKLPRQNGFRCYGAYSLETKKRQVPKEDFYESLNFSTAM